MDAETKEQLETLLGCFKLRGDWYWHKSNEAEWVPVSEDLQDVLTQVRELLDNAQTA